MQEKEQEFSFKKLFIPLTTLKAIHIIIIVGFIVFANSLFNNFVADDKDYIINNLQAHMINLPLSFGHNIFNHSGQYRPIPALYFSILYNLFGNNSFFYHILQLSLHIFCTSLMYVLLRKFLSAGIALFFVLLFLVHPMNVESVSYIAQSVNELFVIFGLGALLIATNKTISKKGLVVIFFLAILSLLTKETGILFLFLILIYSFLYIKKNIVTMSILTGIILIIYTFFRIGVGHVGLSTRQLAPIADLSLYERLLTIPAVTIYYIKTFFFPKELAVFQQWVVTSPNRSNFYLPLLVDIIFFICIGVIGILLLKRLKADVKQYLFFLVWFTLGLFFHLQIFPLDFTVADRWFYFPMLGLLGLLGVIYQDVVNKISNYRKISIFLAIIIVFSLSLRTMVRNADWQNNMILYTNDAQITNSFYLEQYLGLEYQYIGKYDKALQHLYKSVSLRPNDFNVQNIAVTYQLIGNIQKAKEYYRKALHANNYGASLPHKHNIKLYTSYAGLLFYYDEPSVAESLLEEALRDYPDSLELWNLLTFVKGIQHDKQGALSAAYKAYQINPNENNSAIYNNLLNNKSFTIDRQNMQIIFSP